MCADWGLEESLGTLPYHIALRQESDDGAITDT